MQILTSTAKLLITGLLTAALLSSCAEKEADTETPAINNPGNTDTQTENDTQGINSSSLLFETQLTTADYQLVIDESNYADAFNSYAETSQLINSSLDTLNELVSDQNPDADLFNIDATVSCPTSGTFTKQSQRDIYGNGSKTISTQNCEFSFGFFEVTSASIFNNYIETGTKDMTYTSNDRVINTQIGYAIDTLNVKSFEWLIDDSDFNQYFVRFDSELAGNIAMYGSNNSYAFRNPLYVYDELKLACTYETNVNNVLLKQNEDCLIYFELDALNNHWIKSGGKDSTSEDNIIYQLTVTADANFSIALNSELDTYLYVLDHDFNLLAENDDVDDMITSGLGIELTIGFYYITAATFGEQISGDFELIIKSDLENSASLLLFQEEMSETPLYNIDTISNSWLNSGGEDPTALGNSIYELTVTQDATFLINLNSAVDNYLYLLDENLEVIDENDDSNYSNAALRVDLTAGTYYITAATLDENKSGDFELIISSDVTNSANLSVYQ
ncbi:MAG: hypothetical protein HRU38_11130 [Saccharospirillaceae bacterium]|nr:hypothetical protein [Pseudomonadales bacterium]NRB79206.1 hypothetical protein [Saccharospirillaceae bacterium]